MKDAKQWYALYTRGRWEKKVAEQLTRKKIENYCPLNKMERQWSDRKKTVMEPLFTSYVFIHVSQADFSSVKQTGGVINFVYWLGKPAVIRDEEINIIQKFLNEYSNVKLEKMDISVEDNVRIIAGPLMSVSGKVTEVKNKTVKIQLPSMGYAMIAEIEKTNIEKANIQNISIENTGIENTNMENTNREVQKKKKAFSVSDV
jgi:transcription antitermination factor NusG